MPGIKFITLVMIHSFGVGNNFHSMPFQTENKLLHQILFLWFSTQLGAVFQSQSPFGANLKATNMYYLIFVQTLYNTHRTVNKM